MATLPACFDGTVFVCGAESAHYRVYRAGRILVAYGYRLVETMQEAQVVWYLGPRTGPMTKLDTVSLVQAFALQKPVVFSAMTPELDALDGFGDAERFMLDVEAIDFFRKRRGDFMDGECA